jgi:hypothetical protein
MAAEPVISSGPSLSQNIEFIIVPLEPASKWIAPPWTTPPELPKKVLLFKTKVELTATMPPVVMVVLYTSVSDEELFTIRELYMVKDEFSAKIPAPPIFALVL